MSNKVILNIKHLHQSFGKQKVLHDIDLQIIQGQFVGIVGPSGCGKTTLFNCILGTSMPTSGYVQVNGKIINGPSRDVGVVYQKYGLYQFLTAEKNVAFGPMLDQTNLWQRLFMPWFWFPLRRKHLEEARSLLTKVKLDKVINNYPSELSGGQQQRVAIAQSLIMKPHILLLDEPFGALDELTRESLQKMLLYLYRENISAKKAGKEPPWTVLFVTHELNEAFYVSDRVIGLSRNWHGDGLLGEHEGSTKVWDKCTPTFDPDGPKNFEIFHAAKEELKSVVLNDKSSTVYKNTHVSFWSDLKQGVGTGVSVL